MAYHKATQDRYKDKCLQISIRYGVNDDDLKLSQAIVNYCKCNNLSLGGFVKLAIVEKLERDGYI